MVMNISCKFEKASYNIFFVRAATVKSLYTLWQWRRNEAKSIVSIASGGYNNEFSLLYCLLKCKYSFSKIYVLFYCVVNMVLNKDNKIIVCINFSCLIRGNVLSKIISSRILQNPFLKCQAFCKFPRNFSEFANSLVHSV